MADDAEKSQPYPWQVALGMVTTNVSAVTFMSFTSRLSFQSVIFHSNSQPWLLIDYLGGGGRVVGEV